MKHIITLIIAFGLFLFVPNSTQATACPLSTNTMYKSPGSKAVYYITADCKKQLVKSPDVFFSYADSWAEVKNTNYAGISSVPDHQLRILPWGPKHNFLGGSLIKSPTDPRVFLVVKFGNNFEPNHRLISFESEEAFLSLGFKWKWVEDVSQDVITSSMVATEKITANATRFPSGILFKIETSPALFVTAIDPEQSRDQQYAKYVDRLEDLEQFNYRYDHVAILPFIFYYSHGDTLAAPKKITTPVGLVPINAVTCAGANTTVSGLVTICQDTEVALSVNAKLKAVNVNSNNMDLQFISSDGQNMGGVIKIGSEVGYQSLVDKLIYSIKFVSYQGTAQSGKPAVQVIISTQPFDTRGCDRNEAGGEYYICEGYSYTHAESGLMIQVKSISNSTASITVPNSPDFAGSKSQPVTISVGQSLEVSYIESNFGLQRKAVIELISAQNGIARFKITTTL